MFQFHWISITEFNGKNPKVPLRINLSHWPAPEREPGRGYCSPETPQARVQGSFPGLDALTIPSEPVTNWFVTKNGWLHVEMHFMNLEKVKVLYKNLCNVCFSQKSKLFLNCKAFLLSCTINCGSLCFTHSPVVLKERNDGIRCYTRTLVTYNQV